MRHNISAKERLRARFILFSILLVALFGTAGVALPYPVLSPYFVDVESTGISIFMGIHPKILLGISLAAYPLGTLFGSSIIGALSDRYGRKQILSYSLIGGIVGYILTAWAFQQGGFILFIFARLLTGFFEGNSAITRAVAAELHPVIDRDKSLSLLYATIYGGWLIGPLMGGYLAPYGVDVTFFAAAVALVVAWLLVMFSLPSSEPQFVRKQNLWTEIRSNHSFTLLFNPQCRRFFLYYFIYALGLNAYYEFYPLWMVESLGFGSEKIALTTLLITTVMITTSVLVASKISKAMGDKKALFIGNGLLGGVLLLATQLSFPFVLIPIGMSGALIAVINIVFPALLAKHFGHLGQGKVMGLQVSVFNLCIVLIALIGSVVSLISAASTIVLSGVLILLSVFAFVDPEKLNLGAKT